MTTILSRRGSAAAWTSANSVLAAGERGLETDTGKEKIGNGSTAWTALGYTLDSVASTTLSNVSDPGTARANIRSQVLDSVRVAATANLTLSGAQTVDGVALVAGDRLLAAGQTTATENGPWVVASGAWTRPTDYASGATLRSRQVLVNEGTSAGGMWQTISSAMRVVGTDVTAWSAAPYAAIPPTTEAIVFVSKTGSDSKNGLTAGNAKLTVQAAMSALVALSGGTGIIRVGPGTFGETTPIVRPDGCTIEGSGELLTTIIQLNGQNKNVIQDSKWGVAGQINNGGVIANLTIHGNRGNQTAVAPETLVTSSTTVTTGSTATLPVQSTTNFPSAGSLLVGITLVTYTGITSTSFTGVQAAYTGATLKVEMLVVPFGAGAIGHGLALQSNRTRVENVNITQCLGSGLAIQGSGTNAGGAFAYEAKIDKVKCSFNTRWGLEIMPYASDGMVSNWVGGCNAHGEIFSGGVDWEFVNMHPIGEPFNVEALAKRMVTICGTQQMWKNTFLDLAPYDSVVIDMVAYGGNVYDIDFDGQLFLPSSASAHAGVGIGFYGDGSTSAAQRLNLKLNSVGRVSTGLAAYPISYLVGVQNLAAPIGGKVQVLSVPFSPLGSAAGGTINVSSSGTLAYTGSTSAGAATTAAAAISDTTLTLTSASGFTSSGIVTLNPTAAATEAPVQALRISYTGITGNQLTGVTGITQAVPAYAGVAQHFLTGVSGGTGSAVADNVQIAQPGRGVVSPSGFADIRTSKNGSPAPNLTYLPLRQRGEHIQKLNPFLGTVTVPAGQSTASIAHGLQGTPNFVEAAPTANPQQLWWVTKDSNNVTLNLAAAAVTNPVTFSVVARLTWV